MRLKAVGSLSLSLILTSPAWAATPAETVSNRDILVTAQKREESAWNLGIPLSVAGRTGLDLTGAQPFEALARQLPSVQIQTYSPTIVTLNIRGVAQNDYADHQEAPVAFYEDEIYSSAPGMIAGRAYDLERVEVLRGPQGTLFGRNATGGLVQFVTAKPTDTPAAFARVTLARFDQFATEGAISGPLAPGVRARLSATSDRHDGHLRNRSGRQEGNARFYAGRLQLEADAGNGTFALKVQGLRNDNENSGGQYSHATAAPDALGLGVFLRDDQDAFGTCAGCDALGYREPDENPYSVSYNDPTYFDRKFWGATLRYDGDIGFARLSAYVDYQHLVKDYAEDSDMSPVTTLNVANYQNLDQWSGELRLSGQGEGLRWLAGLNAVRIDSANSYVVEAMNSVGVRSNYGGDLATRSLAVFGQAEYDLAPQWSIIAGLRYTRDRKRYDYVNSVAFADPSIPTSYLYFDPSTQPDLARRTFHGWSGKLQLDYRPSDAVLVYASYDRGTKSGGYGAPALPPADPRSIAFDEEVLNSWSTGVKARLADGRAHVAATAFIYDYRDYQAFELVDLALAVRNKDATIRGVEVEGDVTPMPGLFLNASAAWLHGKVKDVVLPGGGVADRRMPNAPRFSATLLASYDWAAPGGTASLSTNWRYDGMQYFSTFNAPVDREEAHLLGDARLAWRSAAQPVELALFVNNVTDNRYRLFNLDFSTSFGFAQSAYARPRWAGVSLTFGNR